MADNDTENEIQIFYELMYNVVQSINRLAKIFKESDIDLGEKSKLIKGGILNLIETPIWKDAEKAFITVDIVGKGDVYEEVSSEYSSLMDNVIEVYDFIPEVMESLKNEEETPENADRINKVSMDVVLAQNLADYLIYYFNMMKKGDVQKAEGEEEMGEGDIDEGSYDYVYGNEKPTEVEMKFASQSEIPLKLQQELHNYYSFVLDIENKTADLVNSLTAKDAPYTERDEIIHLNAFYQKVAFVRKGIGEALGVMNEIESLISDAEFDRNI